MSCATVELVIACTRSSLVLNRLAASANLVNLPAEWLLSLPAPSEWKAANINPGMTVAKGATITDGTPRVVKVIAVIGTVNTMLRKKLTVTLSSSIQIFKFGWFWGVFQSQTDNSLVD